jgi:ribosomal protein S12 methylthiotransferase accessory factor
MAAGVSVVSRELRADQYDDEALDLPAELPPVRFRGQVQRQPKVLGRAGGRSLDSAALLEAVKPVLAPAGITRLANITGLDRLGVPVTLAIRPNGLTLSNSAGKGLTLDDALASAAMEALELFHAEEWTLPTEQHTYHHAFRHLNAPSPDRLPLTGWGPFVPEWHYRWVQGWDLVNQRDAAVPAAMVRMGDRQGRLDDLYSFQVTSNGLASGTTLLEAIHSALLEVIERDAVTCWQFRRDLNGTPPPAVASSALSGDAAALVERISRRGGRVLLFDCSTDTQIPVYTAFLFDDDGVVPGIYKGFGAHLDPSVAVIRAVTEACQARAVHIAGSRDDLFRHRLTAADIEEELDGLRELFQQTESSPSRALPMPASCPSFDQDIALMLERLTRVGLDQVIVVDLSKPYLPVSVVKVVVPGLEGYLVEDYAPGYRALAFARGGGE